MKSVEQKLNTLKEMNSLLFVLDFSVITNIASKDNLEALTDFLLRNKVKVAVSREFYENYEVVIQSSNDEQKSIAQMTYRFLSLLNQNNELLYMSNIVSAKEIIEKLHKNPNVCFIYYKNSEFSEMVLHFRETFSGKAIIVDALGDFDVYLTREEIIQASENLLDVSVIDDDYFAIDFVPEKGIKIKTRDHETIEIGDLIGSGGEGAVYESNYRKNYVVKIYHPKQLNKLRLKKLFLMEKKQVRYNGICWPEKVVYSEKGVPVGYLMRKVDGKPLSSIFDCAESVLKAFPSWKKQDLLRLSINILQKIQYLHLFGILIGDLRLKNIVVDSFGNPCLVDIDSCQIENLPCPIGYPDFTPPELQHIEFKKVLRTYENEDFSCAVLLFKLLFCGIHPYDQRNGAETIEEEISDRSFPYPQNIQGDFTKIPWGGYEEMWRHTPHQMQTFLYDIFKNSIRYSLQEMILMLKTYNAFLDLKKAERPLLNQISF